MTEGRTKTGKVTIRTVAKDAGVSVAAVSKVIRNAYGVSDSLRDRVTESIERLGYRPNRAARGMRGQTYTVGLLLVGIGNPFLPEVIEGVNRVLAASGYQMMIGVGRAQLSIESALIESMIDYQMDGLILIGPRMAGSMLDHFARQLPMAVIGHHEPTAESFDTVNSDDRLGGKTAVAVLQAAGYTDIAMISPPEHVGTEFDVFRERERGYYQAMEESGNADRIRILRCREDPIYAIDDLDALLDAPDRPSAVFCWSDLHAIPLLDAARSRGLKVPDDLAVIGYDNSPIARLSAIGLSSFDQSATELGAKAAGALSERISGRKSPKHLVIPPQLKKRDSY